MSILLETTLGDLIIDLDIEGSPHLCRNLLKLIKARYYTNVLIYNVQPGRFFQSGDPRGDGTGGSSIYGLIDVYSSSDKANADADTHTDTDTDTDADAARNNEKHKDALIRKSQKRFLKSEGRSLNPVELREKGRMVAMEMMGASNKNNNGQYVKHTIGSQFLITTQSGKSKALDGFQNSDSHTDNSSNTTDNNSYLSLGKVVEDDNEVLAKIDGAYCDHHGRPHADIRIIRAHILHDPYNDPEGMSHLLSSRGIQLMQPSDFHNFKSSSQSSQSSTNDKDGHDHAECAKWLATSSPQWEHPPEEIVEPRIDASQIIMDQDLDEEEERKREYEAQKKQDKSRAVILEMVGDIASADMKPPDNVLFVCKLNSVTTDEDLELIFSRFDTNAKAEIIRDYQTGESLQYAFIEFTTSKECNEAYFKMNNALIDDRRIKVDFSQSVAKVWNKYAQQKRGIKPKSTRSSSNDNPYNPNNQHRNGPPRHYNRNHHHHHHHNNNNNNNNNNNYTNKNKQHDTNPSLRNNHTNYSHSNHRSNGTHSRSTHHSPSPTPTSSSDRSLSQSSSSISSRRRRRRKKRDYPLESESDGKDSMHHFHKKESRNHHHRRHGKYERGRDRDGGRSRDRDRERRKTNKRSRHSHKHDDSTKRSKIRDHHDDDHDLNHNGHEKRNPSSGSGSDNDEKEDKNGFHDNHDIDRDHHGHHRSRGHSRRHRHRHRHRHHHGEDKDRDHSEKKRHRHSHSHHRHRHKHDGKDRKSRYHSSDHHHKKSSSSRNNMSDDN